MRCIRALFLPLKILIPLKQFLSVRIPKKVIYAKFERKILISYAGTSHLKFTHWGYKEGKFKILIWTLNTINFVLKLISIMHWFQNCLQNQNPLHINLEINKSVFSYFPFSGNFLYLGIFLLQATNYELFSISAQN